MDTAEYLQILKNEIHSTTFATIGADGHPQVRIIDIMLADENSVYFITARGKEFYRQLEEQNYVAISGVADKKAIWLRGKVRQVSSEFVDDVFRENPYMNDIYPVGKRDAIVVYQIYEADGEYMDISQRPVFRDVFVLGKAEVQTNGYYITDTCVSCAACLEVCPQDCITKASPYIINQHHCIHCGRCAEVCPSKAVVHQ